MLLKLLTHYHFLTFIRGPLALCSHLMLHAHQTRNMVICVSLNQQKEAAKSDYAFLLREDGLSIS